MATCQEIIAGALLELGVRALGDTPAAEETERGLIVMQAMYREGVDKGVFGRLEDYLATANYTAKEQQRIYSAGFTITIPTSIVDADTGVARRPLDLAMVQVVNAATDPEISVYDAATAAWVRLDNLTLAGTAPFSGRNRHALECAVARRLAASFQKPIPDSTSGVANGLASVLSNQFSAARTTTPAEFF